MAVRFSADGQDFTRALALGSQTQLTVTCWVKITVDRNTWSTPWTIDNGTGNNWLVQTGNDGVTVSAYADGNQLQSMGALTVGTWYFIALAVSGTGGFLYHKTAAASGLTTVTVSGGTSTVNAATLRIGESPWGSEWLNGCVAGLKAWIGTQLTAAEVDLESRQFVPNRIAGLTSWHPFVRTETADYSGNARTLSGGTGSTTEDGPPIPWQQAGPRLVLPASSGGSALDLNDPSAGGLRVGVSADSVLNGLALADPIVGGLRASTTTDRAAAGIAVADPAAGGIRAGNLAGETAANTLIATDPHADGVRAGSTTTSAAVGVIHADTAGAVWAGARADTPLVGVVLADRASGIRAGATFGETTASALIVLDPSTGQIRLGSVGGETTSGEAAGEFVCQDFAGTAEPVVHGGTAEAVSYGGHQPAVVAYGGQPTLVSYGGTASICGR